MGRECRRVPADWQHPKNERGYIPLLGRSFSTDLEQWNKGNAKWQEGLCDDYQGGWKPIDEKHKGMPYSEWDGPQPTADRYMPEWPDEERTHYQMYEDTTEGTPISPVMETPEALALWLVENKASAFASQTASYEGWLRVCKGGWAPSMVVAGGVAKSGVDGL